MLYHTMPQHLSCFSAQILIVALLVAQLGSSVLSNCQIESCAHTTADADATIDANADSCCTPKTNTVQGSTDAIADTVTVTVRDLCCITKDVLVAPISAQAAVKLLPIEISATVMDLPYDHIPFTCILNRLEKISESARGLSVCRQRALRNTDASAGINAGIVPALLTHTSLLI